MDQKNRLLTPLVIAAAISVVAFAGIGVAAITGHLSITQLSPNPFAGFIGLSKPTPASAAPAVKAKAKSVARNQAGGANKPINFRPGTRVAANSLVAAGRSSGLTYAALNGTGSETRIAVNFVLTLRMEDGTVRTIYENQRPPFSIGERVRLINGSVVPLG
jgi:hypothetical protein